MIIKRLKWYFFKKKLFRINRKNGGDLDGDIVNYNGKKYYVVELTKEVRTLTTP